AQSGSSATGLQAAISSARGMRMARFSAWRFPRRPNPAMPTRSRDEVMTWRLALCSRRPCFSQFDDALFAPRDRRGFGELQRFHAIVDRRAYGLAVRDGVEEMRHLVGIRHAVTVEEKVLGLVGRYVAARRGGDFRGAMVAGLKHAATAEHFEALVVTVRGAADGVDLRE